MTKYDYNITKRWERSSAEIDEQLIDMFDSTHLLIGGETKSGKSTLLNAIMLSAIAKYTPAEVMFCLVDPKRVELSQYKNIPHTISFVKEATDVPHLLNYVCRYMENEYDRMESIGIRKSDRPHIYIVIDEIADLMVSSCSKEIQVGLQKILQKGRAANIHIIACTQSPSRKTLPAELVLNFTNRVALHCASAIESRQILNEKGAENIPELGMCLYKAPMKGIRLLSGIPCFTDEEIKSRVAFWEAQNFVPQTTKMVSPQQTYTRPTSVSTYTMPIVNGGDSMKTVVQLINVSVALCVALVELAILPFKAFFWITSKWFR